jgi:chromosome segregation ATPase
MERYKYPLLTASEIHVQLKHSLGISLTSEEDITKPKPDTLKEIYIGLLCLTYHKTREDLTKPTAQELSMLKYPDTGDTIVPTIKIFRHLQKILSRIGCKDDEFKLTDLLNPDFKRTRKFLSAFINFLRFMTEEQDLLMDQNEEFVKSRVKAEEFKKIKEEKEKLTQEVQNLKKIQLDQQPVINQKLEELSQAEAEKSKVLEERKKIEEKVQMLIVEVDGYEKSINQLNQLISEAENTKRNMEQNIIEDPEKFTKPLQEKKDRIIELSKTVKTEQNISLEVAAQLEKMENIINKVREAAILVDTINISNSKYKELCKTLETHKQEALTLEKEIYQKSLEKKTLENELQGLNIKIEKIQKTGESKLFTIESSLDSKRSEKDYVLKQQQDLYQELNEKKKILQVLEDQFKAMEDKHLRAMKELKDEHEKTIEKAQNYSRIVFQTIENHEFPKVVRDLSHFNKPHFEEKTD